MPVPNVPTPTVDFGRRPSRPRSPELTPASPLSTERLIVDEADRLTTAGLELVRDYLPQQRRRGRPDRMPGFERRLARYPQLYSRVGFAHHYRPLDSTDIPHVLSQYWQQLGLTYDPHHPADGESVVTNAGITAGNFRLIERLMNQVARIMTINNLDTITPDAIEAAREVLVVGA